MARPKVPLISRRKALEAALEIVDREGLEALSIRRLGEALNVNGASLYHHFKNKDDILVGVTQLALADVTSPRTEHDSWRVWLPLNAYRTRQALVAHPALIPVLLRRVPLGIGAKEVEASIKRLEEEGVRVVSLWAGLPHYITTSPNPRGALALVKHLSECLAFRIDESDLIKAAADFEERSAALVASDPELSDYVRQLKRREFAQ